MKTKEDRYPWDPRPEDQNVDRNSYKAGIDQVARDVLRFLELIPDIKMAKVRISSSVAFPLSEESLGKVLTKSDFEPDNAPLLLAKLGVPIADLYGNPTPEDEVLYGRLVCRYLGAHRADPAQRTEGFESLELALKSTDGCFKAILASNQNVRDEEEFENKRAAVEEDARMKEIRSAVLIPKFGKTFQGQNPNIPLRNLRLDKERFLRQTSTRKYPLFGASVIRAVLRVVDEDQGHQGAQSIKDELERDRYDFHDEDGNPLDQNTIIEEHTKACSECSAVQDIKNKSPPPEGHLVFIPEEVEHEVLLFADKKHQGYAVAHKRIKGWADFPNFERKVLT